MTIQYILASLIIFSLFSSLSYAETGYENEELKLEQIFSKFESSQSCNCVSFRLDDIQGYWLNEVQLSIIETLHGKKAPVTIGIIGGEGYQFGIDPKITNFVIEKTNAENSLIEVANHGWNHESFPTFDKKTQSDLIRNSNDRISKLLGVTPKVFIPPFNQFNNDTITAMGENGITHFSSSLIRSDPPYPLKDLDLYHFPETSTTGRLDPKLGIFEKTDREETFEYVNKSLDSFGYAVVTMHPQEFSILENGTYSNQPDFDSLRDLELLIDDIQSSGLKTVFLSQINENVIENKITVPEWFENVYVWWSDDKIGDKDFTNAVKFLQEHSIIRLIIEKQYDVLANFSLSRAIIEQENIRQRNCSEDWTITGYYIPDESDFSGELKQTLVGNSEIDYKTDFLDEVKIEGWGRTSQGYYLGWHDDAFHIQKSPLDAWQNKLEVPSIAVDPNQIELWTSLTIPSLPYPWVDVIFETTDVGPAILDKHIDVFVGDGSDAKQETFELTSNGGRVCIVDFSD